MSPTHPMSLRILWKAESSQWLADPRVCAAGCLISFPDTLLLAHSAPKAVAFSNSEGMLLPEGLCPVALPWISSPIFKSLLKCLLNKVSLALLFKLRCLPGPPFTLLHFFRSIYHLLPYYYINLFIIYLFCVLSPPLDISSMTTGVAWFPAMS